jgi:hypothetical protein
MRGVVKGRCSTTERQTWILPKFHRRYTYIERKKGIVDLANFRSSERRNDGLSTQQINTARYRTPALHLPFRSFFQPTWVLSGQALLLLISLTEYVRFGLSEIEVQRKGRLCINTMNKGLTVYLYRPFYLCC